jgi:radical SAM protein with 4Fe4S-binding SPASM domain
MCNIWKGRQKDALRPEHMRKLPRRLKTINFSGGEPFLRQDLPEFVREARQRCPGARITISTNAYAPDKIAETMGMILRNDPSVRLAVSLDGLGESHDEIRGDGGAFESAMALIERLTAGGYRGLRLGMTLSRSNLDQLAGVAGLAAQKGLELGVVAAHGALTHLGVGQVPVGRMPEHLTEAFRAVIGRWLRSWRPKLWLRAHFAHNTCRLLAGAPWRFRCRAAGDFFFLQADGAVYSCSVRGRCMGNITTQDWDQIWRSRPADDARMAGRTCRENCWMICTARSVYRRRPLSVAGWIVLRKSAAHLGIVPMPRSREPASANTAH